MADNKEYTHLFGDQNPVVRLDVTSFPPFLQLQDLTINIVLARKIAKKTGIKTVNIYAQGAGKRVSLQSLLDPKIPKLFRDAMQKTDLLMPDQANLTLPFPYRDEAAEPTIPSIGAVLVINSDTLEKYIKADEIGRSFVREARTWVPYMDRFLRQTFLSVGSANLVKGIKRWGISPEGAQLVGRWTQLRFDVNSGPILSSA